MAQDITRRASASQTYFTRGNSEGIVGIVVGGRHGQPDHQRRAIVEFLLGKYGKWVSLSHFTAHMRAAVDPDDRLTLGNPPFR